MFVLASYLCSRLWGAGVAVWFTVVNWAGLDSAVEGLTEPLFMALLCGSFLAVRKQHWALSALLASGATIVRPVGIFALVAIGLLLLSRQEMRRLIVAGAIALAVGAIYILPMSSLWRSIRKRSRLSVGGLVKFASIHDSLMVAGSGISGSNSQAQARTSFAPR